MTHGSAHATMHSTRMMSIQPPFLATLVGAIAAARLVRFFLMQHITIMNIPNATAKPKPVEMIIHAGVPKSSVLQPKTRQLKKQVNLLLI